MSDKLYKSNGQQLDVGGGSASSVPASGVSVASGTGLNSTNAQAAFKEVKDLIDQSSGGATFVEHGITKRADSLTDGQYISLTEYPQHNYAGDRVSLGCKITTLDKIVVCFGHGKAMGSASSEYTSKWFEIDATNIKLYTQTYLSPSSPGSPTLLETKTHGLTISQMLQLDILINDEYKAEVNMMSVTAVATKMVFEQFDSQKQGLIQVVSDGSTLTDVTFSAANPKFGCKCWIFGASQEARWIPILNAMGYHNYLANSMPGRSTVGMMTDCQRALAFGRPKYVLVCCSNDGIDVDDTEERLNDFIDLGVQYGFEVLTIVRPNTPNTITPQNPSGTNNNQAKRELVKSMGIRYVDWGKATSANSDDKNAGYAGFIGGDGVHYTTLGATSVAFQTLEDFPEIKM